jgi:hypothetical protein
MSDEWVILGREVVASGRLEVLRRQLGLNRTSMAYLLQTTGPIYTTWERNRSVGLRLPTAARIGRFYHLALRQVELLDEEGIKINLLVPLHQAITLLGVPQELMMRMYRRGDFEAVDLGILGLWLYEEDLEQIRGLL